MWGEIVDKYGVAYPSVVNGNDERTINNMYKFPQVRTCKSREEAIKVASKMNEYMYGRAVPFENLSERREVNWTYITEHEIK